VPPPAAAATSSNRRTAWPTQRWADDLETYLEDPDLDSRLRNTYTKTAAMLARNIAEELGLPTRTVMVAEQSTYDYRINGVDIEALMKSWQEPSEHGMPAVNGRSLK
jgi:hypothetical protein